MREKKKKKVSYKEKEKEFVGLEFEDVFGIFHLFNYSTRASCLHSVLLDVLKRLLWRYEIRFLHQLFLMTLMLVAAFHSLGF